ncbi:DUF6894 family protein [Bradyrhizobium neotropicale]|uniref:DUF6894 family protein n=1 Tax=Bradyrhizobium neotropicale TaxID=1497615 RepID=UPI001AD6EE87|nr:hypothetical protein [Bradyrhizobium neotropicale]MBO4226465.1 hypothetical protein [Bradyrhizobium neotropicale]
MPLYFFRIRTADGTGICNDGAEFADRDAAWKEMTRVCADMIGGVSRHLQENAEWQIELLDEARSPVFRIRLVAKTLE